MASLTHVCMWSEQGWKRVTASEAAALHPGGTVSARSGLFMCELCGQSVLLTDGTERIRYFKHSAYEKSKDCPERTFVFGTNFSAYSPRSYELPLRITQIVADHFTLEIGFLFVARDILHRQNMKTLKILLDNGLDSFTYSFERLNESSITYLSVGKVPSSTYHIECTPELQFFWPKKVSGADPEGCIFDGRTGVKLIRGADVQVGRKYYLLRRGAQYCRYRSISIHHICRDIVGPGIIWYVYKIEATEFTEDAARFFLDFYCRLTDTPVLMQPVWPPYEADPYVIKHDWGQTVLHISGQNEITTKAFPAADAWSFTCETGGKVARISSTERQQLISAGRTNVQQYLYLWKKPLRPSTACPKIRVTDINGSIVEAGILEVLPPRKTLVIKAPFDGMVVIWNGSNIQEKRFLSADQPADVDELKYGMKIEVVQGLDTTWMASFVQQKACCAADDDAVLLARLKGFSDTPVCISHNFGAVAGRLVAYPRTKEWVYCHIRAGKMPRGALLYLKRFLAEQHL